MFNYVHNQIVQVCYLSEITTLMKMVTKQCGKQLVEVIKTSAHIWNQRNKKGPKTGTLVGAAIEQFMNYDRMHDWLVKYLYESKTVVGSNAIHNVYLHCTSR
ncbi:Cytochrome P450 [Quillaja saponaria]|uniref:Cytochrome P450 n=1 Tax=Quillaja saponaria TaxID=32244 RepID=A0AAD7L910_QUISA|nr:Cytochrome P450 [Quillaja saponaria]